MSILNNSLLLGADAGAAGYEISRSLRFNSSDSAFCSRVFSSAGSRTAWTWSGWAKKAVNNTSDDQCLFGGYSAANDTDWLEFGFGGSNDHSPADKIYWTTNNTTSGTTALYRDSSAWYHIVASYDGANLKFYVNNELVLTSAKTGNLGINVAGDHAIGKSPRSSVGRYFNGYLADVHFIDGQALTPSSFTETSATTGQLIPKQYTGSFGTNGFWLKFSDNSAATATTLGKDYSGNSNNWTPNNLSVTAGAGNDSLVDTPSSAGTDTGLGGQVTGNYCTWGAMYANVAGLSNGNLDFLAPSTMNAFGSISLTTGKWYWEVTISATGLSYVGIMDSTITSATDNSWSTQARSYQSSGNKYDGSSSSAYGASYATGDVIGFALDLDSNALTFYKNGVSQGVAFSTGLIGKEWKPHVYGSSGAGCSANFGQRQWVYAAPAGFKALVDTNIPVVIAKPSSAFDVKLYTGNGSSQTISGFGFSPDLVWVKGRNAGWWHTLTDTVRGAGYALQTNVTNAEIGDGTWLINGLTSDGFSVNMNPNGTVNQNNDTYVAWAFDAGTTTTTNTQGSITSQVRANASAGFSIVTYTGTRTSNGTDTIGHGLGVAPELILIKRRDGAADWHVKHKSLTSWQYALTLNSTGAQYQVNTTYGTMSAPTSAVFSTSYTTDQNVNGYTYVAYCFSPVVGYSAMGSWTGSGNADGPAIWTGFRPRFLLWKRTDSASDWTILDAARDTYNYAEKQLVPNLSQAEAVTGGGFIRIDFLSNGFKLRGTDSYMNASGGTYIYFAVAESPFAYSRAR